MFEAGNVQAILGAQFNPRGFMQFDAAMKKSGASAAAFESAASGAATRTHRSMGAMAATAGKVGVGAFAALTAVAVKSVKAYEDYNRQMQAVKAVSGASAREMAALGAATKKIGSTTKFSATEAAAGSVELVKAGMSITQVIGGGLNTALSLAAAGDIALADAATYASNAMNLFGIEAEKSGQIADALATAANATTADVGDFGMALTQGGAAARTAGLSFKDTMVILEALAKGGTKNSDAGTSLKTSLIQLLKPTKKQAELQKELGLSFVDGNGKMKDAVTISRDLNRAAGDMTKAQRLATFATLAGTDGVRTLSALYDAGPAQLKKYADGLGQAGEAARVAKEKQQGLSGSMDKAKAALNTMFVTIGERIAPAVAKAADAFQQWIARGIGDGTFARFGDQLIAVGESAANVAQGFYQIGSSAASAMSPVAGLLASLNSAMPKGASASIIGGIAAGFLTMRMASAAAPGVERMAGSIRAANAAARAASFANAASSIQMAGMMAQGTTRQFGDLRSRAVGVKAGMGSLVGGLGAVAAGIGPVGWAAIAAGAGFSIYSYAQQRAADGAKEAAQAIQAGADAVKAAGDEYMDAAQKQLQVEQTAIQLSNLKKQRREAEKAGDKGRVKEINNQIAQGDLLLKQQKDQARSARREAPKITKENLNAQQDREDEHWNKAKKAREDYRRAVRRSGASTTDSGRARKEEARKEWEAQERLYQQQVRRTAQMKAMKALSSVNVQRAAAGKDPVALGDAQGVLKLKNAIAGLPKKVQTDILVKGSSKALGQMGDLVAGFKGLPAEKKIMAILRGDGSVKDKLAAIRAIAIKDKDFLVKALGAPHVMDALVGIKNLKIGNKEFTVTEKHVITTTRDKRGNASTTVEPRARGVSSGGTHTAMVGEGSNPREYVVNSKTGKGYMTTGPMLTQLGADDYVVPVDQRYRGRAMGLFMALGHDLGVPGYKGGKGKKKGKKGSSFPIPAKYQRLALSDSLEDLEADVNRIKAKKKGKRKGLKKAQLALRMARRFSNSINKQEDLVEIAEGNLSNAAKTRDSAKYNAANKSRSNALRHLVKWLRRAIKLAPNGSKWERELKKKLNEKIGAQLDVQKMGELSMEDWLTASETSQLDAAGLAEAQAGLTATPDDDRAAAKTIADIREAIYNRALSSGAPGSIITQAANDLKSARDNLTSALAPTQDESAILKQTQDKLDVANRNAEIANKALAVFGGSGDIASGGPNAYSAAGGGVNVTVNTLHPGDPSTLSAIAGAATAGINAQGYVPSSRVRTGV